jgi:hypothetical protein
MQHTSIDVFSYVELRSKMPVNRRLFELSRGVEAVSCELPFIAPHTAPFLIVLLHQ